MSKGKKGGKAQTETVVWDEALVNETIEDEHWHPNIIVVVGESASGESQIQALSEEIKNGKKQRKKFVSVTKDDLFKIAQEDSTSNVTSAGGKKSKQGRPSSAAGTRKPPLVHPQVCERVMTAASSAEPIPLSLIARMIKYVVLKRKAKFNFERESPAAGNAPEQEKKSNTKSSDKKRSRSPSGRTSKAGKKTKEAAPPDLSSVPIPLKPPTEMKKRGEEDEESKYINDEPDPGPTCYFVLSGFSSLELISHLAPIKLRVNSLVKVLDKEKISVENANQEEEELLNKNLTSFWEDIDKVIKTSPGGSMLRDMARAHLQLDHTVIPQDEFIRESYLQALYSNLTQEIYALLKLYTQYQHYLNYLQLYNIPGKEVPTPATIEGGLSSTTLSSAVEINKQEKKASDMRHYNSLLRDTPQENITVPLILHAMVEQVSATLNETAPNTTGLSQLHPDVTSELTNIMNDLILTKEDRVTLGVDQETKKKQSKENVIISHGDDLSKRSLNLPVSSLYKTKYEEDMLHKSGLNSVFALAKCKSPDVKSIIQALDQFVSSSSKLTVSQFHHALLLLSLDNTEQPSASNPPSYQLKFPKASSLLFDHPFNFELVPKEEMIVPISELPQTSSVNIADLDTDEDNLEADLSSHMLNISRRQCRLLEYSSFEVFDFLGLLQELISAKDTHPYMEVYEHKHTESIVIVLHTGFNGLPTYSYKTSSHVHTKVGFTNFLDYVLDKYGLEIEDAVEEDKKKKMEPKVNKLEVRDSAMMLKIKEAAEKQQLSTVVEEEGHNPRSARVSITPVEKSKKRSSVQSQRTADSSKATSAKKKAKASLEVPTPLPPSPLVVEEPQEELQCETHKRFTGYNLGDVVLLKEMNCSTAFTADGVQLRTTRLLNEKDGKEFSTEASVQHNGHVLSISQVWMMKEQDKIIPDIMMNGKQWSGVEEHNGSISAQRPIMNESPPAAGVPKPPQSLLHAQMSVSFNNSLRLSYSYFGPKGDGEIPSLPIRPGILDAPAPEMPRPPSQNTSQKLSKKQLEQQQQLLEQYRLEQEKFQANKNQATVEYERACTNISRNNKYQQLFVSTECGLNVHCHPMVDLEADPSIVDGTDSFTVIKQWYSNPNTASHLSQDTAKEKYRYYHPKGFVVKFMTDKSVQVLGATGYRYRPATAKDLEEIQKENSDETEAQDRVNQQAKSMISNTGVTFTNNAEASDINDQTIWVVTTPLGKSYLWKPLPQERRNSINQSSAIALEEGKTKECEANDDHKLVVAKLSQLHYVQATDPVTNEVYITREDNVALVQHPNGSCVSQFQDGTRFTATYSEDQRPLNLVLECEGFARVCYNTSTNQCQLLFPDQSIVTCSTKGLYNVKKNRCYDFSIKNEGCADYTVPGSTYSFDHTKKEKVLYCKDSNSNMFSVNHLGDIAAQAPNPVDHVAFEPRYFILKEDKTAFELHRGCQVEEFIANVTAHDAAVVTSDVIQNQLNASATTIIEPINTTRTHPVSVPMRQDNIVPYNLRCGDIRRHSSESIVPKPKFGSMAGRGLSIGKQEKSPTLESQYKTPVALRYRQFIHFRPLTRNKINKVYDILASHIERTKVKATKLNDMQPVDRSSPAEKERSKNLQLRFPDFVPLIDIKASYNHEINEKLRCSVEPIAPPISDKGIEFVEQSKLEIAEAKIMREALRKKDIHTYFESEQYKARSPVQSPDMKYFSSKLAKPLEQNTMSRSTLKSSTVSLILNDSSSSTSLQVFDCTKDQVDSSISQSISQATDSRPVNPTPKVAINGREPSTSDIELQGEASKVEVSETEKSFKNEALPALVLKSHQRVEPNIKFAQVEAPVRRKVKTSSVLKGASKLKGFRISPLQINFGLLCEGSTYKFKLKLTNVGVESEHFKVKQPPPSTGIKVVYTPGAVAAGLTRSLTVEIFAMAVGAIGEQGSGEVSHDLQIITESDVIYVPIAAHVLTKKLYDVNSAFCRQANGVELVTGEGNRPRPLKV